MLLPAGDYVLYLQLLVKHVLAHPSLPQNALHGLLLQVLFLARQARGATLERFVEIVMNHQQELFLRCRVGLTRGTFFEVGMGGGCEIDRAAAAGRVDALRRGAGGDYGQSAAGGGWVAGTRVERGVDACGAAAHRVACGGWSCW